MTDLQFWSGFINIIILDLVLSGDNAVVIGMASRKLPLEQRKKAIIYGSLIAVFLRITLTLVALTLLSIPLLKTVGGILLIWIAIRLLADESEDSHIGAGGPTMKSAIKTIIVADVIMSLDNVLAVAGASHGNFYLVLFGLALSIPILMWGSKMIAGIINRFPSIEYIGSAILGYTAGELLVSDDWFSTWLREQQFEEMSWMISAILAMIVVAVGWGLKRRARMQ
ncbi:TerC family protein [Mechercharimyces sp. CAU 1602]|uniref:TerC family protein n=1 Tax=Mechercharimyces sp. CAU 1602 TaxID=2973933 RepID=UPI002163E1CE|nr:TerC family protein [Mechercharimyces sp. CAU 1602]MCS1350540.1 TerC family protein [Mechercharimyces sp. CAU 1602]